MMKTRSTLQHFFTKPVVDLLLPHIVAAEKTKASGESKKNSVVGSVAKEVNAENIILASEGNNISVPWRLIFPILIDAIVHMLNVILGKHWITTEVPESTPPMS